MPETMENGESPTITACVIARDEAERLPGCLESVSFCDEILLVDSGSVDDTVRIAKDAGARVIEQPWLGFPAQRNVALENARGEWVLEIDADERITPKLREEIVAFLAAPASADVDMGALPLRNIFLGRPLGPSAKYPEYRRRLLRRGSYRHDEQRTVHEALIPHGPVHPFTGDLEHLLAADTQEAVTDAWRYARLEAGQMQAPLTPVGLVHGVLIRPPVKFLYRMLIDGGWRDGWRGTLKIAIDCSIDAAVWLRHLLGRRGQELGRSGVSSLHYGATNFRAGGPRIVAVAAGPRSRARALAWLSGVADAGGDVCLLTGAAGGSPAFTGGRVRVRSVPGQLGPLGLIRALDAEEQLRTMDAVVAFGARARALLRIVPPVLRGTLRDIGEDTDPHGAYERVRLSTTSGRDLDETHTNDGGES